jgi:hypothetical protein
MKQFPVVAPSARGRLVTAQPDDASLGAGYHARCAITTQSATATIAHSNLDKHARQSDTVNAHRLLPAKFRPAITNSSAGRGRPNIRAFFGLTILILTSTITLAAPTPMAKEEIEHLFAYVGSSNCAFYRNGTWYSTKDAVEHMRTKYNYLRLMDRATTAESFVERAATRSSVSGKPYLVQCDGSAIVESGKWLTQELTRYRNQRPANQLPPLEPAPGASKADDVQSDLILGGK